MNEKYWLGLFFTFTFFTFFWGGGGGGWRMETLDGTSLQISWKRPTPDFLWRTFLARLGRRRVRRGRPASDVATPQKNKNCPLATALSSIRPKPPKSDVVTGLDRIAGLLDFLSHSHSCTSGVARKRLGRVRLGQVRLRLYLGKVRLCFDQVR